MMRIEPCATLDEIVLASRILAQNGILDSFGHVSARHPDHPDRYLISRVRAPALVEASDIHVFDQDSVPMADTGQRAFIERVIHGCIYRARTDVMAACHHHSPAMLPFCITDVALRPVSSRRHHGRRCSGLGQPGRIRGHKPAGGIKYTRQVAVVCLGFSLDRAATGSRRDNGWAERQGTGVSYYLWASQCPGATRGDGDGRAALPFRRRDCGGSGDQSFAHRCGSCLGKLVPRARFKNRLCNQICLVRKSNRGKGNP